MGNNLVYMAFSKKPVLVFLGESCIYYNCPSSCHDAGRGKKWGTSWGISVKPLLCVCPFQETVRIPCRNVYFFPCIFQDINISRGEWEAWGHCHIKLFLLRGCLKLLWKYQCFWGVCGTYYPPNTFHIIKLLPFAIKLEQSTESLLCGWHTRVIG